MPFLVTGTVVAKKRQQKLEGPVITVNPRFEKTCVLLDWSIVFWISGVDSHMDPLIYGLSVHQ
jgi:anaerobic selenocysteine-containing dehydrogenase